MARHFALVLVLGLAACGVGGGGDDSGDDGGSGSGSAPPTEPVAACTAQLAVSGTFTAAAALDPTAGCQPAGNWAVTVSVSSMGDCTTVPSKTAYAYTVSGAGRDTQLMYSKASGEDFTGAVEASGAGTCEGSFDHVLANGAKFDEINLHPSLAKVTDATQTTLVISGTGTYNLWNAHP